MTKGAESEADLGVFRVRCLRSLILDKQSFLSQESGVWILILLYVGIVSLNES